MDTKPHAELPPLDDAADGDLYSEASAYFHQRWPIECTYDAGTVREIWLRLRRERQLLAALQSIAVLTARAEKAERELARLRSPGR